MIKVRKIEDGEIITKPGLYRMSMTWYHDQCCAGPSISSTGIRKACNSPHSFWKTSPLNPDRYPEKPLGDALILGKAAHSLILGDEVFDEHFCFVPNDAPKRPTATQVAAFEKNGFWSDAAKEGATWWSDFDKRAAGRMELTSAQVEKIKYMAENIAADPMARELLTSDLIEVSLIWQDPQTGLWLKSRPDCLPSNGYDFGDLKTFSPKGADLVLSAQRASTDHGYPLQMALALMGAEEILRMTSEKCGLVFCQTTEPYEVIPQEIDEEALYWARVMIRKGINSIAHGLKTGEWPGVSAGKMTRYAYPPSMLHRFGEMQEAGDLPNLER